MSDPRKGESQEAIAAQVSIRGDEIGAAVPCSFCGASEAILCKIHDKQIAALRNENERLRRALEEIRDQHDRGYCEEPCSAAVARAALAGGKDEVKRG